MENPHDQLTPSLSKLAITAHVRDGEHLAMVYGLPAPVVGIIKQHHGTSVLKYFLHKAKQEAKDEVYEESYRYEEEKPRSKEAAIVMLADNLEAVVSLMENPTRRKIQGLIQETVLQKIQDGQLDESDLTLSDLHKIEESFDQSLLGLVGQRPLLLHWGRRRRVAGSARGWRSPPGPGRSHRMSGCGKPLRERRRLRAGPPTGLDRDPWCPPCSRI